MLFFCLTFCFVRRLKGAFVYSDNLFKQNFVQISVLLVFSLMKQSYLTARFIKNLTFQMFID